MEAEENRQAQVLRALEALKEASKDVETNSGSDDSGCNSPSMKALLELETGSADLLSGDPKLNTLSSLLSRLKSLASTLNSPKHLHHRHQRRRLNLRSLLGRPSTSSSSSSSSDATEISRVAGSIGSELQSWIDRRSIARLLSPSTDDDEKSTLLIALESRLSQGFDSSLQDLLLRSAAFSAVESLLADPNSSKRVRDCAAAAILAFVRFNKDVFVGEILMGPAVVTLASAASPACLRALNGLISSIRSPLVDELHAAGGIKRIVVVLASPVSEIEIRVLAFESVLTIGYFGRKEAVEAMMEQGVVEILMELQRSELGGALIEIDEEEEREVRVGGVVKERERRGVLEARPFASCVARFSIQLEVGEGLRQREKREMKLEIVRRVRAAASSDAEAATVLAEVLWGSTRW